MEYLKRGKANILIDGQWGSTGKGKLAGYLALRSEIDIAVCDFQTNAGHTFVDDEGHSVLVQQVPSSLVNDKCLLLINAGATITLEKLQHEIDMFGIHDRLKIHPLAGVVTQEDLDAEQILEKISSTKKGVGSCLARKIMRQAKTAIDFPELSDYILDTTELVRKGLYLGQTVLIETAQGFDLSINHGYKYPYTTSRDITVMTALNNAGIPPTYLGNVWGSLRTFPIRVGNVMKDGQMVGYSGDYHQDQNELTWGEISSQCGCPFALEEKTTVTKKVRRIFTFSLEQLHRFIEFNHPTHLFINFVNYWNWDDNKKQQMGELSAISKNKLFGLQESINIHCENRHIAPPIIALLGTGEMDSDMIEVI